MEQFANNASSALNGAINNSVTSLVVTSASGFPVAGNFRILIDSELILVGAISGSTLSSLTRGVEGTSAANHSNGATVTHVLTSAAIQQFRADTNASGTHAARPAAGYAGRLYFETDTNLLYQDNGSSWAQWSPQQPSHLTTILQKPVLANFSIINQGGATIADSSAGIVIADNASNDNWRMAVQAVPSTPYSFVFLLAIYLQPLNYNQAGVIFRDSSTGKLQVFTLRLVNGPITIVVNNFSSPTAFAAAPASVPNNFGSGLWFFKVRDDGTNVTYSFGIDGVNWSQIYTVAKSAGYLGSSGYNQIGFGLDPASGGTGVDMVTCLHMAQGT